MKSPGRIFPSLIFLSAEWQLSYNKLFKSCEIRKKIPVVFFFWFIVGISFAVVYLVESARQGCVYFSLTLRDRRNREIYIDFRGCI